MSYTPEEIRMVFKRILPNQNFMTPRVLRYGSRRNGRYLFELSVGEGFQRNTIYGMTLLKKTDHGYEHVHDMCAGGFHDQQEAWDHLNKVITEDLNGKQLN